MSDGGRQILHFSLKFKAKDEMSNVGRKSAGRLVEMKSKFEISDTVGQLIHWLVKVKSKDEVSYGGRKVGDKLIEVHSKSEMSDSSRKEVD